MTTRKPEVGHVASSLLLVSLVVPVLGVPLALASRLGGSSYSYHALLCVLHVTARCVPGSG
jgi:hypothetical protein